MDAKDEIKARLPIEQLVAQYCQLTKKGRNFVCLCPFHNDKKPSFLVSPDKGIGYCFACSTGGDIFSFYQKIESVDFPTALRALAEKANVELPKERASAKPAVAKDEKQRMRECLDAACDFYQAKLEAIPIARDYVSSRGVPPELKKEFRIGYAPDSFNETYDYLLKKGFSRSEILGAGLGIQKELSNERMYDRFRNRIIFPITDNQGNIIGFGGRTIGNDDAKYVNSPDGPLYHKSSVLFGLFQARDAIRTDRTVMLVEGYFDVVACHKAGVRNAVAVSGTALTEEHVKLLKRYADTIVLCLDQDVAGRAAADRAFGLLARGGLLVESVRIQSKDPDELVQQDPSALKTIVETASLPYIDACLAGIAERKDINQPAVKAQLLESVFTLLDCLPTSTELRAYIEKAAQSMKTIESELLSDFRRWKNSSAISRLTAISKKIDETSVSKLGSSGPYSCFELVIGLGLVYIKQRPLLKELIPLDVSQYDTLREAIIDAPETMSAEEIIGQLELSSEGKVRLSVLVLYCEEQFGNWSDILAVRELKKIIAGANKELMIRKQHEIIEKLKTARANGRADDEARLLTTYQQVLKLQKMAS